MNRTALSLLGVVVLVAALGVVVLVQQDAVPPRQAPPGPQAAMRATDGPDVVRSLPGGVAQVEPLRVEAPAPPKPTGSAPGGRLVGRVTHAEDGRRAAGVRLRARFLDDRVMTEPAEVVTDEDGHYVFTVPEPARLVSIDVAPGRTIPRQQVPRELDVPAGGEAVFDFEIAAGASIAGHVLDISGRPVGGAAVRGWTSSRSMLSGERLDRPDQATHTGATGEFEIHVLGPEFVLAAATDDLAAHTRLHGRIDDGAMIAGATLVVSPARSLVGQVLGPTEQPLAEARIEATARVQGAAETVTDADGVYRFGPPTRETTSAESGRFTLDGLCARRYEVRVRHPDHPDWLGTHGPGDGELVIRMARGLSLTGTVVSRVDGPLAAVEVRLGTGDLQLHPANRAGTTTDEHGRFAFHGLLPDSRGLLLIRAEGHAVHVEQPVTISAGRLNDVRVIVEPERRLAGVVTDPAGAPVVGASVSIEGDRLVDHGDTTVVPAPTWERQFRRTNWSTDGDGAFRIDQLYDGLFRLEAMDETSGASAILEVRSGREDLHVVLDPDAAYGVTLEGVATDATTGRPVREFVVTPMIPNDDGGMGGMGHGFEDERGHWRITGLEAGPMLMTASSRGYAPWSHTLTDYGEGMHVLDIAFLPTRTATFRVVDGEGDPVAVRLGFQDGGGRELMVEAGPGMRHSSIETDARGEAIAAGLPAERITVSARRGFLSPERSYVVDLRSAPRGPIELVYGESETQTVMVLVLTGSATTPERLDEGMPALPVIQEHLMAGRLAPLHVPVPITVRDLSGLVVVETTLEPADGNPAGFTVEGVERAFATTVEVPLRPLLFEAEAPGFRAVQRSWEPGASASSEFVVLLLTPE